MVMLLFNSCKKELYVAEKIDQEQLKKIHSYQNGAKLNTINFTQFKSKANLQSLGALKDVFLSPTAGKGKLMSINIPETYNGFAVQTDSIKVLNTNGHTSYIFPVKLSSPNAITFQNLTIDESTKGTVVFVNTYKPTQKWIDDWKKGKEGKFDGDISVTYLSGNNDIASSSNKFSSNGKIASTNNNLSVIDANGCNVTTYYFELPYNCGSGQHGPYDSGCHLTGDDAAGIALINFEVTVCGPTNTVGGGGGSTTPNPPGDYNPCGGGSPTVTIIAANGARGDKLMVAENNPCDETLPELEPIDPIPLKEIKDSVQNQCIKTQLNLALNAKTTIKEMLDNTFGGTVQFEDLDLIFRDPTNLADTTDGEMQRLSGIEYEIRLNQNILLNSSKEYILSTIYHEILHAYLESKLIKDSNGRYIITDQHQDMATKYVTLMSGALKIGFPSLSNSEAWALSWGGLEKTPFYTTILTNDQRKAITNLNDRHKNKTATNKLGSYCN